MEKEQIIRRMDVKGDILPATYCPGTRYCSTSIRSRSKCKDVRLFMIYCIRIMTERIRLRRVRILNILVQVCSVTLPDLGSKENPSKKKISAVEGAIGIKDREKA